MLRKGVVERQVELLSSLLSKLLKLTEVGNTAEAGELLHNSCRELTGLNWNLVHTLPTESLLQFLTVGGMLDAGRCATVAVLLHEQGMRDEAEERSALARSRYQTAFLLLRAAMEKESLLHTPEFQNRRTDLLRRLTSPPGTS
jgi:hypothetical protein